MGTFYNPKIVTDGLILHLDAGNKKSYAEGSSIWNDLSKNKYTASLVNNAIYNSINGGVISFYTGANSYVQIPSRLVQDDFTLCVWFQSSGNSVVGSQWYQGHGLIDCEVSNIVNDYGLSYLNNKAAFGIGSPDQTIQSSALINDGEWKYIVATRTKSTGYGTIYINGNINASGTFTNKNSLTAPSNTYIGSSNGGVGSYGPPSGSVAVAQIYNKVLTPSEILQNYNATKNRFVKEEEATIPQEGLHTWLESDYGVITIDGAGNEQTTPVSGNYVKRWESKVGTINFAQTTTTAMPIYRIDSNGIPYLSFEGNDTLNATVGNYNFASTAITSWFAGWYRTGTATHQDFFSVTTGGAGWPGIDLYARQSYGTTNSISLGVSSSPGPKSMAVVLTNQSQVNAFQAVHFDLSPIIGGTNRAWLNNGSVVSGTNTAATLDPQSYPATPTLGRYGGNYNYLTGRVYYFVVYSGVQPDHTTMYNYFSTKYQYT